KAIELEAERLQQEALYARSRSASRASEVRPPAAARANLAAYERVLGARFPNPALDRLVSAFGGIKFYDLAPPCPHWHRTSPHGTSHWETPNKRGWAWRKRPHG